MLTEGIIFAVTTLSIVLVGTFVIMMGMAIIHYDKNKDDPTLSISYKQGLLQKVVRDGYILIAIGVMIAIFGTVVDTSFHLKGYVP